MNKIVQYLNEHILGEVLNSDAVRQRFSKDGGILTITPEIVVHPRVTNDIRKIARFSWQLAEKGHIFPITVRGGGSNKTGAAIGKGIIINTLAHLNNVIFINAKKEPFVHVQPGVTFSALNEALKAQEMLLPTYPDVPAVSTVGGAVADNKGGPESGRYGLTGDMVTRLEVVLANGDLIETSRINRHELNKKKGLQTFEGEIYRKIDGIIEDNQQIINDKLANIAPENTGYTGIAKVKGRDGSFDLTPLLTGSQGTLGIISEIVLNTAYHTSDESIVVAVFDRDEVSRDAADTIAPLQPTMLEFIDGRYFDMANSIGRKYVFTQNNVGNVSAVLYVNFNDFNDHLRKRKFKDAMKRLSKFDCTLYTSNEYSNDDLKAVRAVSSILETDAKNESKPPILDGSSIPVDRREEFVVALKEMAGKNHVSLPIRINWLTGVVHTRPTLRLHEVTDKQRTFKLVNDYIELVAKYGGSMCADGGEGRLKASAAYSQLDNDELSIYEQIKDVFDPFGILNTGVKQQSDLKTLVSQLNSNYNGSDFAQYSPVD